MSQPAQIPFSELPVNSYFEFEGSVWFKHEPEGLWNANCGTWAGQFEANELVKHSDYQPPKGFQDAREQRPETTSHY